MVLSYIFSLPKSTHLHHLLFYNSSCSSRCQRVLLQVLVQVLVQCGSRDKVVVTVCCRTFPGLWPLTPVPQPLPAARGGGRSLDLSVSGVRRQRRELHNVLPYADQMMSYPASQGGGLYYQSDDWKGRGLDQALQRLVERDQRRELEEEQRAGWRRHNLNIIKINIILHMFPCSVHTVQLIGKSKVNFK